LLTTTSSDTFMNLPRLNVLGLSYNKLLNIQRHQLLPLGRLRVLDMSYNNVSVVDRHLFQGLMFLEYLNLLIEILNMYLIQIDIKNYIYFHLHLLYIVDH
jgi:Leucine-rich repeat (LRR) protein